MPRVPRIANRTSKFPAAGGLFSRGRRGPEPRPERSDEVRAVLERIIGHGLVDVDGGWIHAR